MSTANSLPTPATREEILAYMLEQKRLRARGILKMKARKRHMRRTMGKVRK